MAECFFWVLLISDQYSSVVDRGSDRELTPIVLLAYLPLHFVTNKIMKKLFNCPALSSHGIHNALVNAF